MPQLKLTPQLVDELVRGARTDQIQRLLEVNFNTDLLDEEEIADLLRITDELGDFEIGMDYLGSALQTAKAGIADRLGFEDYAQQETLEAARTLEEAQLRQETPITPITDVYEQEGLFSALGYAPEFAGRTFLRSAPEMGAGLIAARLGARLPMKYGGIAGFGAVSVPAFTGRNLQRQMEEQGVGIGDTDLTKAGIAALGQAGADALLYRTIGALGPQRAGREIAEAAQRGYRANIIKRAREGALVEAGTESFQQAVEMLQADPTLLTEFDEDTRKELMESAIAGGLIGAPIAAVSAPIETARARAKVKEDLDRHMREQAEEAQRMADAAGLQDTLLLERDGEDLIGLPSPSDVSVLPPISVSPDDTATATESPEILDLSESIEENFRKRRGVLGDDRALPSPTVMEVPPTASQRGTLEGRLGGMEESVRPEGVSRTDTSPTILEGDLLPPEPAVESREPLSLPTPVIEQEPLAQRRRPESGEGPSLAALPRGTGAIPVPPTARQRGTLEGRLGGMEEVVSGVTQPDISYAEETLKRMQLAGLANPFSDSKAGRLFDQLNKQEEAGQTRAARNTKEKLGKRLVELGFEEEQAADFLSRRPAEREQLRLLSKKSSAEQGRQAREEAAQTVTAAKRSEFNAKAERIRKALARELRKLGLKDVDLRLDNLIDGRTDVEGATDQGANNAIITLATRIYDPNISDAELEARLREVMNHELIHALRMVGVFTDAEFQTLVNSAKNQLFVDTNGNERTFTYFQRSQRMYGDESVEIQEEEAVAEMFRDWSAGRKKLSGAPQTFFQRVINFFKSLGKSLDTEGFDEATKIFEGITSGELTRRERQESANELFKARMLSRKGVGNEPPFYNFTDKQIKELVSLNDYPNSSVGYVVRMSPDDFLNLALPRDFSDAYFLEQIPTKGMVGEEFEPEVVDERRGGVQGGPYLEITKVDGGRLDPADEKDIKEYYPEAKYVVTGHEGRHRTLLAKMAGVETVPVYIRYKDPHSDYERDRFQDRKPFNEKELVKSKEVLNQFYYFGLTRPDLRDILMKYEAMYGDTMPAERWTKAARERFSKELALYNEQSKNKFRPEYTTIPSGVALMYGNDQKINKVVGPESDPLFPDDTKGTKKFSKKGDLNKWLEKSTVTSDVFHTTLESFAALDPSKTDDQAIHFSSVEEAGADRLDEILRYQRGEDLREGKPMFPRVITAKIQLENPLRFPFDLGNWGDINLWMNALTEGQFMFRPDFGYERRAMEMAKDKILSDPEFAAIRNALTSLRAQKENELRKEGKDPEKMMPYEVVESDDIWFALEQLGYDGVQYLNVYEANDSVFTEDGVSQDSFLVWNPNQIYVKDVKDIDYGDITYFDDPRADMTQEEVDAISTRPVMGLQGLASPFEKPLYEQPSGEVRRRIEQIRIGEPGTQPIEEPFRMLSKRGGPRITGRGEIVGSPPGARTVAARDNMVRRFLRYMEHDFAVAEQSKDWYERSGAAIRAIARGDRDLIEKIARLMALYSQGNSVGGNTTALIKSIHQLASGQNTAFAGRFPDTTAERIPDLLAAESFDKTVDGVNDKIENFYRNLIDPALEQDTFDEASTMDKWMMRLMGYKVADDEEKGGSSALPDTQYAYAKDIMFRLSDAWYRKTGERLKPRQVQAMLWTYIKNKKEYEKIKDPKKRNAFKPQAVDFGDYLVRATAIVPWEARPSTSIPYLQWLHTAPRQVQEQWNEIVRNILTNPDGTDRIMSLFPAEQLYNSAIGSGAYESTVSPNVQTNIVLRKDGDRNYIYDIANKYAALMGYILSQDAAVWYRPDINAENKYAATGVNVSSNVEITPDLEEALLTHLEQTLPGIGYTKVGNELQFINFRADNRKVIAQLEAEKKYTNPNSARFIQLETDIAELKKADAKAMSGITDKKFLDMLTSALDSFDANIEFVPTTFRATSNYISNDWTRNTNGESYKDVFGSAGFGNLQQTVDNLRSDIRKAAQEFNDRRAELLGYDAAESLAADGRERSGTGVNGRQGRFGYPVYESGRLGPEQGRSSFEGYHYSRRDGLTSLDSSKHGTGKAGAELQRGWRPRVYFYVQQTEGRPEPEQALSRLPNGYGVALENIYNPYKDDYIKQAVKAQNQGIHNPDMYEDMVEAEGYDGYIEWGFKPSPAVVLLGDNNVPVVQDMREGETLDRSGVETEKGASALSADGPNTRRYSKRFSYQQSGNPKGFEAFANSIISDGASTGPFTDFARKMLGAAPNESLWNAFVRNSINRFLPGYLLDEEVYGKSVNNPDSVGRAMEMSQQMLGRMMAIMEFGPIQVDKDGNVSQVSNTNVKGLNEIFAPLVEGQTEEQAAKNEKMFYAYAALRREKALRAKGRRGFVKLTDAVIDQQIAQSPPQFAKIFDDYQEFNGYMVKFAMDSGLMNQQMADEFAEMAYVPFYREMETADGSTDFSNSLPQRASNSLMKPGAFDEKLLGSNFKISGDLFNNIYRNNELIISSGLRNIAMQKTAQALDKTKDNTWGEKVSEKETGPQIMKFRVNGNEVRYRINDGSLWMALAGLTPQQKDAWVKATEEFSNILRMGVTNMPGFMLANLWRGKIDAYVKMGVPVGMGTNTMRRMNDAYKNGDSTMAIKTLTGFGGYAFGADPADFGKVARRKARTKGKVFDENVGIRDALLNLKQAIETVGETTEMEVRVGVYEKLIAEGFSEREAAFQAMNLINYGRKGAGGGGLGFLLVNRILPAVPFMNARIQGLYRLIEQPGVPANKRQEYWNGIMYRGALVAIASSAIGIMAMMDDRWEDESLETKANYDIIYVGDYTIKIPRAFEIGAVFGGFPVFMFDAIRQKDGIDLAKFTAFTFANTFAFNPVPQAALPALEVMTGYDFFRGAPIEGMGLQRKAVEDRYYSSTPYFYRWLSRNGGAALGLSPLELQQLIEGYLAGMATAFIGVGETLAGPVLPSKPNGVFGNPYITTPARALGLTRFIQEDGERSSQFVKEFYELRREADQVHQSIQAAAMQGDRDRIEELLKENRAAVGLRKSFNRLARQMSEINSAMNRIMESPTMSAQEKTDKLRKLRLAKNKLARQMVTIAERYE